MAKTIKDLHSALANVVTSMAGKNNDITYSKGGSINLFIDVVYRRN